MESTEKMPAFLRTTDSVEREFSVPEEYLEKQEKFEQKKAEMLSKWNENFLSQDMSSYHVKYEDHCLSAGRAENGSGRSRTVL